MSKKKKFPVDSLEEDLQILAAWDYEIVQFSEYHYRISRKLDIWPTQRKYLKKGAHQVHSYNGMSLVDLVRQEIPLAVNRE